MSKVEYKIIKKFGVIASKEGCDLELNLISWAGMPEKYDIRVWKNGEPLKGIIFTKDEVGNLGELIDKYFETHKETKTETKKTATKKKTETKTKNSNIIQFPKIKPDIEKAVTTGNATYEDCEKKINAELEKYTDPDSQYVLKGILELCKVDADFRNNVMRESRTYQGAFKYMADKSKEGYAYKIGQAYSLDRDSGLGLTIDYYNEKEA